MNITIWILLGMAVLLVLAIVVTVLYLRDLRRLEEQDRVIKSLRKQLDHLLGTRYQAPPAEYKDGSRDSDLFTRSLGTVSL